MRESRWKELPVIALTTRDCMTNPHTWSTCDSCGAELPMVEGVYVGAWVRVGVVVVSVVCLECQRKMTISQKRKPQRKNAHPKNRS